MRCRIAFFKEGLTYRYDQFDGLIDITDRNGNTLTFSDDGIQHSSGIGIDFIRDGAGRIKEIIDLADESILYDYNSAGELVSVTNQAGTTATYTYLPDPAHYLDEGFDHNGMRDFKVTYFDDGRFNEILDALGNPIQQQNYELNNQRETILDANGNPTILLYDERGNILEEEDAAGNKTIRRYEDSAHPDLETTIIDRRGMVTERQYDPLGNVKKILEWGPQDAPFVTPIVTDYTYNGRNDVTSVKNANQAMTVFGYDPLGKGNLELITNAELKPASFTYDDQGRPETYTDFNGNTTTFVYNAPDCGCANPKEVIAEDGTRRTYEYNQFGQVKLEKYFEADDTLVEQIQTVYDASGRVIREITGIDGADPLHGKVEVRRFYMGELLDWEIIVNPLSLDGDNLLESPATPVAHRLSRITDYEYDANDRLIQQTDAEGGIVRFRYDAKGNRILLQDPVGNITTWTYDVLNRVSEERDPFYWVDFVIANAGLSPDELLDAVVQENEEPSGANIDANVGAAHVRVYGYDAEGNLDKSIDRNDRRREFEYDHAGRLTEERWYAAAMGALVETITFQYDDVGNMEMADDSNSHYVMTYDALNRLETVDNADGVAATPDVLLTYDYDDQGNVRKVFDNAGVTVESTYNSATCSKPANGTTPHWARPPM